MSINTHIHDKNKATQQEAVSGSNNETWMTPLRTKEAIAAAGAGDGTSWGNIDGSIEDQTDLQNQLTQLEDDVNTNITTLSGSVYTDQSQQNQRLDSLEISSGSIISDVEQLSGSFDNRITTLEDSPSGVSQWGDISGSLEDQTDLQNALNDKTDQSQFNTISGSIADEQTIQDSRLNELETTSGSLQQDLDNKLDTSVYNTDSGSFDTRISTYENDTTLIRSGDNISELNNDAGYITDGEISGSGVIDVNGLSGSVDLTTEDIPESGDDLYFTTLERTKLQGIEDGAEVNEVSQQDLDTLSGSVSNDINQLQDTKLDTSVHTAFSQSIDTELGTKIDQSEFDTYSGSVGDYIDSNDSKNNEQDGRLNSIETTTGSLQNQIDNKVEQSEYDTFSGSVNTHIEDSDIHYPQSSISIEESQISDLDKYTQQEVNNLLDDKLDISVYNTDSGSFSSRINDNVLQSEFDTFSGSVFIDQATQNERITQLETDSGSFDGRITTLEEAGYITEVAWGDITGTLLNQTDLSGSIYDLQQDIESKVEQSEFDTFSGSVDTALDNKLDQSVYTTDSGSFDSRIDDNETNLTSLSGSFDSRINTKVEGDGTSKITVSATEPSSPAVGDIWIDTT